MDDKSPLSLVQEETSEISEADPGEFSRVIAAEPEIGPTFTPEELALKEQMSRQFAALNDREMLETILHNQIYIRQTLVDFEAMLAGFRTGIKPSDLLKTLMGKG